MQRKETVFTQFENLFIMNELQCSADEPFTENFLK